MAGAVIGTTNNLRCCRRSSCAPKIAKAKKFAWWNSRSRRKRRTGSPSEIERLHEAGAPWRELCRALSQARASRQLLDALRRQRHSLRHPQVFDSFEHAGARPARLAAPDRPCRRTMSPARACSPRRTGGSSRAIWCAWPSARTKITGVRFGTNWKRRSSEAAVQLARRSAAAGTRGNCCTRLRQSAQKKTAQRISGRIDRNAGTRAAAFGSGPAVPRAASCEFVKEWETQERGQAAPRLHRISRLFQRARRRHLPSRNNPRTTPCS